MRRYSNWASPGINANASSSDSFVTAGISMYFLLTLHGMPRIQSNSKENCEQRVTKSAQETNQLSTSDSSQVRKRARCMRVHIRTCIRGLKNDANQAHENRRPLRRPWDSLKILLADTGRARARLVARAVLVHHELARVGADGARGAGARAYDLAMYSARDAVLELDVELRQLVVLNGARVDQVPQRALVHDVAHGKALDGLI
eukprot:IDg17322t1